MRVRRQSDQQVVTLSDASLLGKGGEARVYRWPSDPLLVAKIWHKATPERGAKVRVMAANPPIDPTAAQKHTSIAWPTDLLEDPQHPGLIIGFIMPYVGGMSLVLEYFNPKTRRQKSPLFNYYYLLRTARNFVVALRALHDRGYVIGDLNESNILVAETALVTIVDTDSFQVWDAAKGKVYRCRVGKPEFTPPELQGKTFSQTNRNIQHDLFGTGVILFQLLMEGTHPFAGNYKGHGDAPPYEGRIAAGHFPYSVGAPVPFSPKTTAPPFATLYPSLQHLFVRCFQDGHFNPGARPDTQAWHWALEEAESALVSCWVNDQHIYSNHLQSCPWCDRTKLLGGRDPFPSLESVKSGVHMGPAVAPPRTSGRHQPIGGRGKGNLPLPPTPRPVPASSGSRPYVNVGGAPPFSGFPGPRNGWAWTGLALGITGLFSLFWSLVVAMMLGILGMALSIYGEIKSHGWYLDGRGRVAARVGILVSALCVIWYFSFYARALAN